MPDKKFAPQKTATVNSLKDLLNKAKSLAIVDYTGMKVAQATQLRRDIKARGGQMLIAKNTLFKIAANKTDLPLTGLSAFIFSLKDEISALAAVAEFIKKNGLLVFKSGLTGNKWLTASEIETLANTPTKETSLAKVLYLLNYNTSRLVRTLDSIAKKD